MPRSAGVKGAHGDDEPADQPIGRSASTTTSSKLTTVVGRRVSPIVFRCPEDSPGGRRSTKSTRSPGARLGRAANTV